MQTISQSAAVFPMVAELLEYPAAGFVKRLEHCCGFLARIAPDICPPGTLESLQSLGLGELQEMFTQTFDVTPSCVPYVSIHLFGEENFKRGEFMAALLERYKQLDFECAPELPDHLAVLLRFLPILEREEQSELVAFCLLSPLRKMMASLDAANPYATVLQLISRTLMAEFPDAKSEPLPVDQMRQAPPGSCGTASQSCHCDSGFVLTLGAQELVQTEKTGTGSALECSPQPMPQCHD